MAQKSKVAVIGLGNIGTVLASNLVKGNRAVIIADRTLEKANVLSKKLGNMAQPATISEAVKEAEIYLDGWDKRVLQILRLGTSGED